MSTRGITTPLPTSTTTRCAVASSFVAPSTKSSATYVYASGGAEATVSAWIEIFHWENVTGTCENFKFCNIDALPYQPNPDIGGVGALSAFLFTAWIVFIMTVMAYWGGLLSPDLLRNADRWCFNANSRHNHSRWKHTFDDIILILSDQQLCFGLGILIAGYYQAFAQDLDIAHWNVVTYLAWLSSTVHLMSLSLIRARLNENHVLRDIRLAGMVMLFFLLLVALIPSVHNGGLSSASNLYNLFPVRCTFTPLNVQDEYGINYFNGNLFTQLNPAVSYVTLIVVYLWKVGQLFEHSAVMIQHYLRDAPRSRLQNWVKRTIPETGSRGSSNLHHSTAKIFFLWWSVWAESLDSFMATFMALLFALSWGTEQLLLAHYAAPAEVREGESAWSFGQILTLLLLLQPAMAVVETFSSSKAKTLEPGTATASSSEITLTDTLPRHDSSIKPLAKSNTLSSTLSPPTDPTLVTTGRERTRLADPVVAHLYNSRMFKGYVYFIAVCFLTLAAVVVTFAGLQRSPGGGERGLTSLLSLGGILLAVPLVILCTWPCSRRLR